MDLSSISNDYGAALTPEVQSQYAVKCLLMERASNQVVESIILDTAEISQEAMNKYLAEM